MQRVAITCFLSFILQLTWAQSVSSLRFKTLQIVSDTTQIDTLSIGEFKVLEPSTFNASNYLLLPLKSQFITKERGSITISYRVLYQPVQPLYKHKERALIRNNPSNTGRDYLYIPHETNSNLADEPALNKSGVISRGITVGNNQDLVLNSIFNLQLSGKLSSDWNILGSISDDNTQLQPDGSTLQLQEFDKVFIKLYNANQQVTMGDFELKPELSKSYFLNYYKRNRGVYFNAISQPDSSNKIKYGASAAAAKGRYSRQVVTVIDGNQGPYRLKGNNGELYVLINAGSERIYLDDKLLTRGYDHDYIIDYNTGEITFTSRRLIIATSRVIAEFQYSDRNYSRAVLNGFAEWQQDKLSLRLHYYSEKDLKNQPVLLELTDAQKQKIASVGDSLNKAFSTSAKTVSLFTNEKILYRKVDTLGYIGVYVLTNVPTMDTTYYELIFNEVGEGRGNYRLIKSDVNGKVYAFYPPLNGVLQGNAEPLQPLTAPQGLQNISLGGDYTFNKHQRISAEIAGSKFDQNEFSKLDKGDDKGYATHMQWEQNYAVSKKEKPLILSTNASFDYVNKNFKSAERFRDINFARVWNRQLQQVSESNTRATEFNSGLEFQIKKTADKLFLVGIEQYKRDKEQDGLRYHSSLILKHRKTTISANGELMQNQLLLLQSQNTSTTWNLFLLQQLSKSTGAGAEIKKEHSAFKRLNNDTLGLQSYDYLQGQIFTIFQKKKYQFRVDATQRNDATPEYSQYLPAFSTNILAANGLFQSGKQTFQFQAQYKTIEVHNTRLTNLRNDQSLTFQFLHSLQSFKNALQHNLQCNAGSGQEQKRIYTFIEVPVGRGSYTWRDYNNDGVKQLNEFEQAYNPDETKYVRVLVPTQDYSKVNYFSAYETIILQPYKLWGTKTGFLKFIGRFENRFTYKNELKQYAQNSFFVSKFTSDNNDTTLLNFNNYIENNFIFNHPFNSFDMRYNYRQTGNTNLLSYGLDTRSKKEHEVIFRVAFSSVSFIQLYLVNGEKQLHSQFFALRNYRFGYQSIEPKLNLELKQTLRITLRTKYYISQSNGAVPIKSENWEGGMDLHWYLSSKSFLDGRASLVNIKFNGDANSSIAYEMLQGLNNGNNILVYLTFMHQISSTMQINLNYNGRATQGKPMIHTGGVEVRYLF